MYHLGVDVGGTFTDVVFVDEKGEIRTFKSSTTPQAPVQGIMDGLEIAAKAFNRPLNALLKEVVAFLHGCTIGTNALITGDYAKIGLITTKGFRDTLAIRRSLKGSGVAGDFIPGESLYDLQLEAPKMIVPRSLTEEVTERVNYDGEVLVPLDVEEAKEKIRKLVDKGVKGIGVCLLWSPVNPVHEKQIMELIKEYPEVYENSSCSVDVIPQIREYERMSSLAISACLKPKMKPYLRGLAIRLRGAGLTESAPVLVMQLHGGVADAAIAAEIPVVTLGSGPVGGAVGAHFFGVASGHDNIITMDMGGTSFDVGVMVDGELLKVPIAMVERYHIMLPMIDVRSIGAGGGSIAYLEKGTLNVGPKSAGAQPGPACYGRGGTRPTVTDANVVLGYISGTLAGGQVTLDAAASRRVIKEHIADPLGMTVEEASAGIFDLTNANMSNAIRLSTIERGYDPSDFAGFVYGGLGACHGPVLCKEMNIKTMVMPWFASVFSAFGVATSAYKHSYLRLIGRDLLYEMNLEMVNGKLAEMEFEARDTLEREGIKSQDMDFSAFVDLRFEGQLNEMTIKLPGMRVTEADLKTIDDAFHQKYSMVYTFVPDYPLEVIALRVEGKGKVADIPIKKYPLGGKDASAALKGNRDVYFSETGGFAETNVYDGVRLVPGMVLEDRAIIEYPDTTIVVRPGQKAMCDETRSIVVDIAGEEVWQ